jgi:hypothetical protein
MVEVKVKPQVDALQLHLNPDLLKDDLLEVLNVKINIYFLHVNKNKCHALNENLILFLFKKKKLTILQNFDLKNVQ